MASHAYSKMKTLQSFLQLLGNYHFHICDANHRMRRCSDRTSDPTVFNNLLPATYSRACHFVQDTSKMQS